MVTTFQVQNRLPLRVSLSTDYRLISRHCVPKISRRLSEGACSGLKSTAEIAISTARQLRGLSLADNRARLLGDKR